MSALEENSSLITRYICKVRGGSQPILAQASDGLAYIVKFANNPQGANLLFNENLGSELYRACQLPVPHWKTLLITDAFLNQNPDCWMETANGRLRPDSGLCFGSRFLVGDNYRLLEILPGTSFKKVHNHMNFWLAWLIDICAGHTDHRQAIFMEDRSGGLDAFFVDHGHLFCGPNGEEHMHFMASRYLDPRIYQSAFPLHLQEFQDAVERLDVDCLWRKAHALPDDWKTKSAIDGLTQCLNRLSSARILKNTLDLMEDASRRNNQDDSEEGCKSSLGRMPVTSVPCSCLQTLNQGRRSVAC